ncbi:hypothetical protein FBU30_002321 [Linnemannia zychae]|nr:hypothetical protein FBU30_002321 [Linnemannia zychae]
MRSFTARVVCFFLTCLFILLCRSATTSIIGCSRYLFIVGAHPITHRATSISSRVQRRQEQAANNALTSTGPVASSPTSTLNQKPLIQIVAPNITLFAALDFPSSSSSSPPSPSPNNSEDNSGTESTPLLLPTASLSLEPNQIYHVDDSLIFGAGGSEPLTGVLAEWTIGCDLGDNFPIYPPTDKPWIAFISSSLLYNKTHNNVDLNSENEEDDVCDVATLIAIVQAISEEVTGVIMYYDKKKQPKNGIDSYDELKRQTEQAIRELAGLSPQVDITTVTEQNIAARNNFKTRNIKEITKRADSSHGLSKDQILEKLEVAKRQRVLAAWNRSHPSTAKLATPGEPPYVLDIQPPSTIGNSADSMPQSQSQPPVVSPADIPSIGVMAMGDPTLIKILQDNMEIKGESVIAQLKFANNANGPHQLLPTPQVSPTPTTGAERPAADRSLGLFFWIILASVVLIVGIWVGFGVVEARSLARRRQQIALDSVKRRTVDQKVLDTYKVRVFNEDDISYSDDDDEEENDGVITFNTHQRGQREQDLEMGNSQDHPKETVVHDEKDISEVTMQQLKPQRAYARADLNAVRMVATDRGNYTGSIINSLALGRRSGSFDEVLHGGLDSARLRRGSTPGGSIFWERRSSLLNVSASLALSRDERCRSWAESGAEMYDYGGESESMYGYDQEQGYKSHAEQGWTDLQIETIKSLDAVKEVKDATTTIPVDSELAAETGKVALLEIVTEAPVADSNREAFVEAIADSLPAIPAASARRGNTSLLGKPTLKHKSRFILPRKIETDVPTVAVVNSGEVTSPTIYGGGSISSAGPNTGDFLPPTGWGGERRRSSLSTVAVPDNGHGVAQHNWNGSRGQRLRRSSLQVQRLNSPQIESPHEKGYEEDEEELESESSKSDLDDGRGVGNVNLSAFQRLRRSSHQIQNISVEEAVSSPPLPPLTEVTLKINKDKSKSSKEQELSNVVSEHKTRRSTDLYGSYSPNELPHPSHDSGLLIHPASHTRSGSRGSRIQHLQYQQQSESDLQQVEQFQDSEGSNYSRRSSRYSSRSPTCRYKHHYKEPTTNTMATTLTGSTEETSIAASFTAGDCGPKRKNRSKKQRKRRYDPCAICLQEYEVGDQLRELPCKHFFHIQCIDPWFKEFYGVCPVCKRDYSEAGSTSPNLRHQTSRDTLRLEQPTGVSSFLAPLAIFATGASGMHHWYAAEATMHMM